MQGAWNHLVRSQFRLHLDSFGILNAAELRSKLQEILRFSCSAVNISGLCNVNNKYLFIINHISAAVSFVRQL